MELVSTDLQVIAKPTLMLALMVAEPMKRMRKSNISTMVNIDNLQTCDSEKNMGIS